MNKGIIFGTALYNGRPVSGAYVTFDGIRTSPPLVIYNESGAPTNYVTATVDGRGFFVIRFQWELGGLGGALNDTIVPFGMRGFRPDIQGSMETHRLTRVTGRAVVMPTGDMYGALLGTNPPGGDDYGTQSLILDMASIRRQIGITSLPFLAPSRSIMENLAMGSAVRINLL